MIEKIDYTDLNSLPEIARLLLQRFTNQRVFAFYAGMGLGKTTLIKSICEYLEVVDLVSSPTFAIINEYFSPKAGAVFHFDFYRLKNIEEAYNLGIEEYFYSDKYCFIEWPEKIELLLPKNFVYLKMEEIEKKRYLTFNT